MSCFRGGDHCCLYGREEEVNIIRRALHRTVGAAAKNKSNELEREAQFDSTDGGRKDSTTQDNSNDEFVFIHGPGGSGKTALAKSIQQEVNQLSGYFLIGKFELACVQNPYAVFAAAFDGFVQKLLIDRIGDEDTNRNYSFCRLHAEICQVIQDAVRDEGALMTNVIPSLELLIGKQTDTSNVVQGANALRRFQYLFCKLCRAISTIVPLVFFFDDLQWGDPASLKLLVALLQSQRQCPEATALLVLGTCRSELKNGIQEDNHNAIPVDVSIGCLRELLQSPEVSRKTNVTIISLTNLSLASTHQMVADVLDKSLESSECLAREIFSKSSGSPFYTWQILLDMIQHEARNDKNPRLQNTGEVLPYQEPQRMLPSLGSVSELVRDKLIVLPDNVQTVLKVGACLGDEIDESAISIVLDQGIADIHSATELAHIHGHLVFDQQHGMYRFCHDKVRQEIMSLIDDSSSFSFQVGYKLWTKSTPLVLSTKMFVIANLLNHGATSMASKADMLVVANLLNRGNNLLTDRTERYRAAALNKEAGVKAASLANFSDSSRYLAAAIDFLKGVGNDDYCNNYWTEQYDLSLEIFNAAADTEVCTQNFDRVMGLAQEVLDNAQCLHHKIPAHVAKINCLCQSGHTQKAIDIVIDVLQQLGEPMPQTATKGAIIREMILTKLALAVRRSNADLVSTRPMEDKDKLHAMHVLSVIIPYTFTARSYYNPLMATRMVRLCLKHGFHKSGVVGLTTFAWVLCAKDRKEGYRLGTLALSMADRLRAKEMIPRVHAIFYSFTHHWRRPIRESIEPLGRAAEAAMNVGDVECAMWAKYLRCLILIISGAPLSVCADEFSETGDQLRLYKQDNLLKLVNITTKLVSTLMGPALDHEQPTRDLMERNDEFESNESTVVKYVCLGTEANLAYRFGDYKRAYQLAESQSRMKFDFGATMTSCAARQIHALIAVAIARQGMEPRKNCKIVRQTLQQLKQWASDCPENFASMYKLLQAEYLSLKLQRGVNGKILAIYDQAIAEGQKVGFRQAVAMAYELAGDYVHRQKGDARLSQKYWEQAHANYQTWGAAQKAAHLFNRTEKLLIQ